jgi:5'-3' exoribonuclease 2
VAVVLIIIIHRLTLFLTAQLDMFKDIFAYIDRIFSLVRPRRLIHLAVDGPAPRAKMNQQRSRRFRAAKEGREKTEMLKLRREMIEGSGKRVLPPGAPGFDSNTITPGTDFMSRLSRALEWYVLDRLDSDPGWANVLVLFSDATIPGEGEHKIMDYIREQRKRPDHDPNLRHVLYGADADLIMLGLASHEPNFTILREEFQRPAKKPCELCGKRGCKANRCPGISGDVDAGALGWQPIRKDNGVRFIFILLPVLRE